LEIITEAMGSDSSTLLTAFIVLTAARTLVDVWLERLNQGSIRANLQTVPGEFVGYVDAGLMARSARYSLARSRAGMIAEVVSQAALLVLVLSGVLGALDARLSAWRLPVVWSGLAFFLVPGAMFYLLRLPFSYYQTFVLEEKFGFNRSTLKLFLMDHVKAGLLAALMFSLLLSAILWLIELTPASWWIWAFLTVSLVHILLVELYPVLIAPLFNKFEPIRDLELAAKITAVMQGHGIIIKRILQMNAGVRSRHTNAYFTGLGKAKTIVLFDTLLESHPHEEILAILAHEVGHFKRKHVLKDVVLFEVLLFAGFYVTHLLLNWPVLYSAFGFASLSSYVGLFLIGIFWQQAGLFLQPLFTAISRHFERDADRFAVRMVKSAEPMIASIRRLAVDNLSNLTPHPLYVRFHYTHPPLIERVRLLQQAARDAAQADRTLPATGEPG
jgi:STE24 endopeptidase